MREGRLEVLMPAGSECTVFSGGEWSVGVCGVSTPNQPLPHSN